MFLRLPAIFSPFLKTVDEKFVSIWWRKINQESTVNTTKIFVSFFEPNEIEYDCMWLLPEDF